MSNNQASESQRRILSLSIRELEVLHSAYMPFVENGGLFIPMEKILDIGEEVFILLSLMEESEKIPVTGTIVWVTPKNAQGGRATGAGVQFKDKENVARAKIENYLAELLSSPRPTHTM